MDWKKNRPIVLASKSPRRKQLLAEAGFEFEIKAIDIDETIDPTEDKLLAPQRLATEKAQAGLALVSDENSIVIGADSIVILNNRIFGKPVDRADAFSMLAHLSGKTHTVVTGVAIVTFKRTIAFSATTKVTFRPMDKSEIDFYLDELKPFDKAGSYGIQDWLGLCKVSDIEGTYANVMGLPIDLVYEGLKQIISK